MELQKTTQAYAVGFGQAKEDSVICLYDSDDACVKYNQDYAHTSCQNGSAVKIRTLTAKTRKPVNHPIVQATTSCYNLGHDAGYASAEKEIVRCHEVSVPPLKSGH